MFSAIREIATIQIGIFPVVVYMGMLTFSSFLFTAFIGYTNYRGKNLIEFKWHPRMVIISFSIASIHALMALSLHLG